MALTGIRIRAFAALLSVVSLAGPAIAQQSAIGAPAVASAKAPLSRIRVGNFGRINDNYYRGAQPNAPDYADLKAIGVKTVIDLQKDGRSDEPGLVKQAGMQFFRIGMTTTDRPTEAQIAQFFKIVNDPANQPVFVHCAGGRHRTGTMTALYRMTYEGWDANRAYAEMRQFRFEGFPDHPVLRTFVYTYKPVPATPPPTVLATTIVPPAVADTK
jgi:tyrosine-protein phosphatase SIW14